MDLFQLKDYCVQYIVKDSLVVTITHFQADIYTPFKYLFTHFETKIYIIKKDYLTE